MLVTSPELYAESPQLVESVRAALAAGNRAVVDEPASGLGALLDANPALDAKAQRAQLDALLAARAIATDPWIEPSVLDAYGRWAARQGIVDRPPGLEQAGAR